MITVCTTALSGCFRYALATLGAAFLTDSARACARRIAIVAIWICALAPLVSLPALAAAATPVSFESLDVAPVWSGHPVHFAIETVDRWQYVAFYDAERRMTVAQRSLDSARWVFCRLASVVGWDSHNYIAMAVDADGYIHVSGNMHGDRLVYFRSTGPHDISSFESPGMVGDLERRVTYPRFMSRNRGSGDSQGELYFQYRDGKSGDGEQILNAYDVASKRWRRHLAEPLLDGGGSESA